MKEVSRERYKGFKEKAEQYYAGMVVEYDAGRPNNCVTLAVHCAISWVDTFTVYKLGKKSSAQSHIEAITLLKEAKALDEKEKQTIAVSLYELIEMKTPAEYEDGILGKKDAQRAMHLCKKIRDFFKKEFTAIEQ